MKQEGGTFMQNLELNSSADVIFSNLKKHLHHCWQSLQMSSSLTINAVKMSKSSLAPYPPRLFLNTQHSFILHVWNIGTTFNSNVCSFWWRSWRQHQSGWYFFFQMPETNLTETYILLVLWSDIVHLHHQGCKLWHLSSFFHLYWSGSSKHMLKHFANVEVFAVPIICYFQNCYK